MHYDEYTHLKWGSVPPALEVRQYEGNDYVMPVGMFFVNATYAANARLGLTPSSIFNKVLGKTSIGYKKHGSMTQLYRSCAWQLDVPEVLNHNHLLQAGYKFPEADSAVSRIFTDLGINRIKEMPTLIKKNGEHYDIIYRVPVRLLQYCDGQKNFCRRCDCSDGAVGVQNALAHLEKIHNDLCMRLIEDFNAKRAKK